MKNRPKNQKKPAPSRAKKSTSKKSTPKKKSSPGLNLGIKSFFFGKEFRTVVSIFLITCSILTFLSFSSYLVHWQEDHSLLNLSMSEYFLDKEIKAENLLGKVGALFSHMFIYKGFGIASYIFVFLALVAGIKLVFKTKLFPFIKTAIISVVSLFLASIFSGFFLDNNLLLGGTFGYQTKLWLTSLVGNIGTGTFILFGIASFLIFLFKPNFSAISAMIESFIPSSEEQESNGDIETSSTTSHKTDPIKENVSKTIPLPVSNEPPDATEVEVTFETNTEPSITLETETVTPLDSQSKDIIESSLLDDLLSSNGPADGILLDTKPSELTPKADEEDSDFIVETAKEEAVMTDKEVNKLVQEYGEYDPTLDLSNYQSPPIDILREHGTGKLSVSQEELEANKDRIVETLGNYKIGIDKIKATIGPTVTLYEIIPEKGIRISKIKNLEDDIAMSLSALGIRIIAPIPGRGTIGIEVPNASPDMVSMKSLIASEKFQNSKMLLPIALGKTIANETYVADLAKMPHLLMAGATGQGKSVGLNAILVSLLYKKHPSQIKFVMVDPKKVELTLFNKIERHYLAKLPDEAEAIITETDKVVKTLKSLTVEMDQRYDLLKNAMVRNLAEYNAKFIARKLNPENGHRFLPYIVLVVDEFADLMMTAGKEVEAPIARLAQLARAIGIHLIIATQRPSVNIITGTIKANFPARIAFRVTSKIDSRTILDAGGADQLIGRGDMLLSTGNEVIRLQCGFVDTPEVEELCDFIGSQKAYPSAFHLPEVEDEAVGGVDSIDESDRDALFEDAARIIVMHQQGSASLLQRKMKIGYNRAGRIIDQLEVANIIGPFEGSKARKVLMPDEYTLEQYLNKDTVNEEI